MSKLARLLFAWLIFGSTAFAQVGQIPAWPPIQPVLATFQGPGDIVSGATGYWSCARVYTAAQASTATSLCDLVAVTGGAVVCTLRGTTSGFVDLAASYCAGTTPAAACAAASGGSCVVTKMYDQTGTGNHLTNATLASMPGLSFSLINGLPGIFCLTAANTTLTLASLTMAQPFTLNGVYIRVGSFTTAGQIIGGGNATLGMGASNVASKIQIYAPITVDVTANDSVFHAASGVFDGAASAVNIDGVDTTGLSPNTSGFAANTFRVCRSAAGGNLNGNIMETIMYPSAISPAQRGNLSTNQHSISGYNF